MLRVGKNIGHLALLDDQAVFHHSDAVGKVAYQVQVMRDEQHRHAVSLLQRRQQLQNLDAQTDIQRCSGFVGQQQAWLAGQRHGDHRALPLTT